MRRSARLEEKREDGSVHKLEKNTTPAKVERPAQRIPDQGDIASTEDIDMHVESMVIASITLPSPQLLSPFRDQQSPAASIEENDELMILPNNENTPPPKRRIMHDEDLIQEEHEQQQSPAVEYKDEDLPLSPFKFVTPNPKRRKTTTHTESDNLSRMPSFAEWIRPAPEVMSMDTNYLRVIYDEEYAAGLPKSPPSSVERIVGGGY